MELSTGFQRFCSATAVCIGAMMGGAAAVYADVPLASTPLFLTTPVKPNILLALDDSGSMDGELLMPTNDGAGWWNTTTSSFTGWGTNADVTSDVASGATVLNFNAVGEANGTWKKFVYLFPNGSNGTYDGRRRYGDDSNDHYAVAPIPRFAWARSPDFNAAYFDPTVSYAPWPSTESVSYSNSTPTAALYEPRNSSAGSMDLTAVQKKHNGGETFRLYSGMTLDEGVEIYAGGKWNTLNNSILVPDSSLSVTSGSSYGISYYPATFYTKQPIPASLGYTAAAPLAGYSPGAVAPDLFMYEIRSSNFGQSEDYKAMIQNFANWFSFYRKRHMATRGGIASSFSDINAARVGMFTINNRNVNVNMRNLSSGSEKSQLLENVYDYVVGNGLGGTPNREAINAAGNKFRNQSDIIQYACQANATVLFTDGYSNASNVVSSNYDGAKGAPYADTASGTLADIAMKFYDSDSVPLRSGVGFPAGRVPVPAECSLASRDPSLDCNSNLHMNTYAVTLGTRGILFDPDNVVDPYTSAPSWWTSFSNRNPKSVDDLWHATINGRGALLNANTPAEVSKEMKRILGTVLARVGSASSVAANSTRLDTGTYIYQAQFDSGDWSGEISAYTLNTNGSVNAEVWSTDDTITSDVGRSIFTWSGQAGVPFSVSHYSSLSSSQRAALGTEAQGKAIIDWVRGSDQNERSNGGELRSRNRLMGDVVNSDPVYSGSDDFGYSLLPGDEGLNYSSFVSAKSARPPAIYFGANDGMLHAVHAGTGQELFAYIPGAVVPRLDDLADPDYIHEYFVDGTARVGDAFLGGSWRTALVGSTGAGGRTLFALDVTDPSSVSEANVLWELTDTVDGHGIGYGINYPTFVRLGNGDWAAVFGNGYNSGDNVKLFVVNLANGALIKAIDTGVSGADNGLGPVSPVDVNGDRIADYIYAGDLNGNLWKFDVSSANSSQWDVAFGKGKTKAPLIKVTSDGTAGQPITSRPVVGPHPDGGYMVYFGTGSYFRDGDNVVGQSPQLQRFYGVRDQGAVVSQSALVGQSIIYEGSVTGFGDARVYSDNLVNYSAKSGWYLDLAYPDVGSANGERVVSAPILRFGRIIFTSVIPSSDPCDFGGRSWLNELDAVNGQRLNYSVFDVNGDGLIDDNDFIQVGDVKVPVGGKGFDEIIKTPGIVGAGEVEYKYTSGSKGTLGVTLEAGDPGPVGRQSWRQLQ